MVKQCPACSSEVPYETAKFCPECGVPLQHFGGAVSHEEQYRLVREWDGRTTLAGFYLVGCDLTSVWLRGADLHGATLSRAKLSRADLSGANLTQADLQWTDLHWANLQSVILHDANLLGAFLWVSKLQGANLIGANLQRASLRDAQLQQARLSWANLQWADLSGADLTQVDLGSANLRGADMTAVNLSGAFLGTVTLEGGEPIRTDPQPPLSFEARLAQADMLQHATMPDGTRYDGRLNLAGDLERARSTGISLHDAQAMASFYRVTRDEYLRGQEWSLAHLERIRAQM